MNREIFNSIKLDVGEKFLEYILNADKQIGTDFHYEEVEFNSIQTSALIQIKKIIDECKVKILDIEHTTLKIQLFDYSIIFSNIRKKINGNIKVKASLF
jgi:hypothetical protein